MDLAKNLSTLITQTAEAYRLQDVRFYPKNVAKGLTEKFAPARGKCPRGQYMDESGKCFWFESQLAHCEDEGVTLVNNRMACGAGGVKAAALPMLAKTDMYKQEYNGKLDELIARLLAQVTKNNVDRNEDLQKTSAHKKIAYAQAAVEAGANQNAMKLKQVAADLAFTAAMDNIKNKSTMQLARLAARVIPAFEALKNAFIARMQQGAVQHKILLYLEFAGEGKLVGKKSRHTR